MIGKVLRAQKLLAEPLEGQIGEGPAISQGDRLSDLLADCHTSIVP